ncbi:MAG: stage III sporulation protein AA [Clostridiales bacterium]|nr:stage III sporulation protein AA [Clostridiales bacterium]
MQKQIKNYFSEPIKSIIDNLDKRFFLDIQEIRLRVNKNLIIKNKNNYFSVDKNNKITRDIFSGIIIRKLYIEETLEILFEYSGYAFENEISNGFITINGGHRVGLCGEVVIENKKIKTIKNISSLNFRIAHEFKGISDKIIKYIFIDDEIKNTVIISPPGCGKTTILRDIIRNISFKKNVCVIDERSEIAACYNGEIQNDLGSQVDVFDRCNKELGMKIALRTMSPDVIAFDEIGSENDFENIKYIKNSGVKIICTAHGENIEDIKLNFCLDNSRNKKIFERYIFLYKKKLGIIKNIFDENLGKVFYER